MLLEGVWDELPRNGINDRVPWANFALAHSTKLTCRRKCSPIRIRVHRSSSVGIVIMFSGLLSKRKGLKMNRQKWSGRAILQCLVAANGAKPFNGRRAKLDFSESRHEEFHVQFVRRCPLLKKEQHFFGA